MVLLTFLLKCCVMTQQEGIMQAVYTFAGTDQCQLPEYGPYSYICKYTAVRPSTCNVVHNAFGHLIRAPHYFQTLGQIGFIYGLMIGMGPKIFSVPSPSPPMAYRSRSRTWKIIVEVFNNWCQDIISKWKFLFNSIIFPRIKSNELTNHQSNLNDNNKRTSQS